MSPFTHADKIKKPLLLIHGEADNNTGTFPMQVGVGPGPMTLPLGWLLG